MFVEVQVSVLKEPLKVSAKVPVLVPLKRVPLHVP